VSLAQVRLDFRERHGAKLRGGEEQLYFDIVLATSPQACYNRRARWSANLSQRPGGFARDLVISA
jgi:hypothetical protein